MSGKAGFGSTFASRAALQHRFEQGLEQLLDAGGMNLFILVAANASFESRLWEALGSRLRTQYDALLASLHSALAQGQRIDESDDDLQVFLKISQTGMDSLQLTEQRTVGPWEVQFNPLRSLRPLHNSQRPMISIQAPYDAAAFSFNRPFMQQETIASGKLMGRHIDLYYNKYPFVELHSLLVPDREQCYPQYLFEEMHDYVWRLVESLSETLPGIRVGYNALGAFASVNHLHLQLFVRERPLPVEHVQWAHNAGARDYPVDCRVFDDVQAAWQYIAQLHECNEAYNLLYTPGRLYCLPRRKQGEFELPGWSNGFSWYELCGGMIAFNHEDWAALDESGITTGLARTRQ
jgi:ATP adenylyltransferase/5',5'''-P-1,P-4-tetraphosphate phosphorylase II